MHKSIFEQMVLKLKHDLNLGNGVEKLTYNTVKYIPNANSRIAHNDIAEIMDL